MIKLLLESLWILTTVSTFIILCVMTGFIVSNGLAQHILSLLN